MSDITDKIVAKTPAPQPAAPTAPTAPTLTVDQIQARVQSTYAGSIRRCYATALKKNADAKGTLAIAFRVEPNGTTSHVELTGDADFASCVRGKIADWKFPTTPAPLDVRLPVTEMSSPTQPPHAAPGPTPDARSPKPDPKPSPKPCDTKNGVYNPFDPNPCAR